MLLQRYLTNTSFSTCSAFNPHLLLLHFPKPHPHPSSSSSLLRFSSKRFGVCSVMDGSGVSAVKEVAPNLDANMEEEYVSQSKLYKEFASMSTIEKAWTFKSSSGRGSHTMFTISQPNLLANKKKKLMLSSVISENSNGGVDVEWAPFPIEVTGASLMVPSPSGSKLLVVRNPENDSPTLFEIWGPFQLEKEIRVPQSKHGSVYADGWFQGISWSSDESAIAYVAEEPSVQKPSFSDTAGYRKDIGSNSTDKDLNSWKGQGDWEEDWGEAYSGKRQPALFVKTPTLFLLGAKDLRVPVSNGLQFARALKEKGVPVKVIVFPEDIHPINRPQSDFESFVNVGVWFKKYCNGDVSAVQGIGRSLSVGQVVWAPTTKGVHEYLIFVGWPSDTRKFGMIYCYNRPCAIYAVKAPSFGSETKDNAVNDDASVINLTQGISSAFLPRFTPDGKFLVFLSAKTCVDTGAHSATQSIHKIEWNNEGEPSSAKIVDVWESNKNHSQQFKSFMDSLVEVPQIKYGSITKEESKDDIWRWLDVSSPTSESQEKVKSLLSSLQLDILKIPVNDVSKSLTKGACKPIEAMYVSSKSKHQDCDPMIVILHGGPHGISLSSFSKTSGGSIGYGEEALQSLLGKVGSQDVNDVLTAVDHAVDMGLANPSKITVLGGSHGGFLTTHLIGQAPDKFAAAVARNPVCNLALMVGTSDIPDWCFVETFGTQGLSSYTEAPSLQLVSSFHEKSPISHISKVKTPTLFLLGAKDLRVPVSNGLQFARALKEKGVPVKVIVFPEDIHPINRPQSDFESFVNVGVWFKKYCK
ncbi:hypothetical protein M8C21_015238 [Ambrosia artemisiifolia]|uniref:acylaminoacyl-peptidase n=1 Tax=Ambrosia artemisiifolia TaxID=4212 RepID=A0AAD5GPU6_AMBAR|nr:hypothetical protein M8C21_015238 [Ambrosia artemisiifolia]